MSWLYVMQFLRHLIMSVRADFILFIVRIGSWNNGKRTFILVR